MSAVLRCKMRVESVARSMAADGVTVESESVKLCAVYGKEGTENAQWSKWTPSASLSIQINNPLAIGKVFKGGEYYCDFTPVPPPEPPQPQPAPEAAVQ